MKTNPISLIVLFLLLPSICGAGCGPVCEENAEWVPGLESRLACANTVFGIPGQPFMHKIRVPQDTSQTAHDVVPVKTGVRRVYNLPEGLSWNPRRCLVEGTAPSDRKSVV